MNSKLSAKIVFALSLFISNFSQASALVDVLATPETQALSTQLRVTARLGFMFGQQNATSEGVDWRDKSDSNFCGDVCRVSGLHPAVYGWDFSDVFEKDEAAKSRLRQKIRQAYEAGGINTISWHFINPVTQGPPKDLTPACERIKPGGDLNFEFASALDVFADFMKKLTDKDGKPIPVIFRPWHEANASWFWWGAKACNPVTLKSLWQVTVEYLRDHHQIHQMLWAYSPNWFPGNVMSYFPGDDFVDILGLDFYFFKPIAWVQRTQLKAQLQDLVIIAHQKHKIAALTEVGYESIPNPNWWTSVFLSELTQSGVSREIAYAMIWRNENRDHFYGPYPGHASVPDFLAMARDPSSLFLEDIRK